MRLDVGQFCARLLAIGFVLVCVRSAGAADLSFTGIDRDSDLYSTLRGGSLLVEQTDQDVSPSPQELVAAAQADYARLLAVLYDQGYFGPVVKIALDGVEASAIPPVSPPRQVQRAVIDIDTGPKFTFAATRISPVAPGTELPDGYAVGETARLSVLKDAVSAGINGWRNQGHAKAKLASQDLTARHTDRTISANLQLSPGPKLRFGALTVKGNRDVRTARIIEIAGLPEGKTYDPNELRLAQQRLRRAGAFSAVALLEADRIGPDDTLPITAQITESKPRRFGFGGELSSLEGVTLNTFWLHRNLLGGAERLRIGAEIKGIGEAGIERFANENRTYTLGLGLRRAETRDAFGTNKFTLFTMPLSAEFDYRDNTLDAKDGYFLKAAVTPFVALSGADNGVRSYVDARAYRTFGTARPVTLAFRGQLGSVYGPDLNVAPADYLFYSGGSGTVRGQPYQTLGVDLGGGNVVGGRSFAGLSAEARISIKDTLGIVGFADADTSDQKNSLTDRANGIQALGSVCAMRQVSDQSGSTLLCRHPG